MYEQLYLAAFQALLTHHGAGDKTGLTPEEVASFAEDYAREASVKWDFITEARSDA